MDPLDLALDLARRAAATMSTNFRLGTSRTWKDDGTPLTVTDVGINSMVVDAIAEAFPDHRVIGEEQSSDTGSTSEWAWICDPVDGTVPFAHGLPLSTFVLALTRHGAPELAVIVDPFLDRLFVAEKGKGATLNGSPIRVSSHSSLGNSIVTVEVPFEGPDGEAIRKSVQAKRAAVLSLWSYSYGACLVACGELSAAVYGGTRPWDAAAAALLVREAGGHATDLSGADQPYDRTVHGLIVSNGLVHDSMLESVSLGF